MSSEIVIRGLVSCVIAGALAWHIHQMDEQDLDPLPPKQGQVRYGSVIPVLLLTALPFLALLILLSDDQASIPHNLLSMCFPIFFSICVYYVILLPALPLLRRRISARTCAVLWLHARRSGGEKQPVRRRWLAGALAGEKGAEEFGNYFVCDDMPAYMAEITAFTRGFYLLFKGKFYLIIY